MGSVECGVEREREERGVRGARASLAQLHSRRQRHQPVWGDYAEFCLDRLQTRLDMNEETLARAETTVRIPSVELITSTYPSTLASPQVRSESRSLKEHTQPRRARSTTVSAVQA